MNQVTPVLIVESIEPVLPFWTDRLGFTLEQSVDYEATLGFVILRRGEASVMYQTRASIAADIPPLGSTPAGGNLLFIEVDDLDAIAEALKGIEPIVPRRRTFYGSEELIVREPGGNAINFAQFS